MDANLKLQIVRIHKKGIFVYLQETTEEQSDGSINCFVHLHAVDVYIQSVLNSSN